MAKGPKPAPSPATPAPVSGFAITFGEAPPATVRKVGQESSPFAAVMKNMAAPTAQGVAQFFIPVEANASITDAGEQSKYKSGEARKITNRVSGIARRLKKADANMVFAMRTREENGVLGVRVYRVAPTPATA